MLVVKKNALKCCTVPVTTRIVYTRQTLKNSYKCIVNQPESVVLLQSWLMIDAKEISSFVLCLQFAPHRVPTGGKILAGQQMPRCTAAPPAEFTSAYK